LALIAAASASCVNRVSRTYTPTPSVSQSKSSSSSSSYSAPCYGGYGRGCGGYYGYSPCYYGCGGSQYTAYEESSGTTETYTYEPAVYTEEVIVCDEPEEDDAVSYTLTENKSATENASESNSTTETREYSYSDDTPSDDEYITSTVYTPHC